MRIPCQNKHLIMFGMELGARPLKNGIIRLLTLFSVINYMSLPHHKIESDALMIADFEELNELFDGTLYKPICAIWSFWRKQ